VPGSTRSFGTSDGGCSNRCLQFQLRFQFGSLQVEPECTKAQTTPSKFVLALYTFGAWRDDRLWWGVETPSCGTFHNQGAPSAGVGRHGLIRLAASTNRDVLLTSEPHVGGIHQVMKASTWTGGTGSHHTLQSACRMSCTRCTQRDHMSGYFLVTSFMVTHSVWCVGSTAFTSVLPQSWSHPTAYASHSLCLLN
jgi:hypothetical protein